MLQLPTFVPLRGSSQIKSPRQKAPQPEPVKFAGFDGLDSFDLSNVAQHGVALYQKIQKFFSDNNDTIQSTEAVFALPFSVLKVLRKAPKLLAFATGSEQDAKAKKKKEAQYTRAKFESIEQQTKETNTLILENFEEVKKALDDVNKQLSILRDAPLAAANDQIISAKEALEDAHNSYFGHSRDKHMDLFKHQMLFAFNQLSTAKQTGSSPQVRSTAAALMSKCAFMLGQPKTAVHNADDALRETGITNPDVDTYYRLGEEALSCKRPKQAEFFFMIGILKANEIDMREYNGEHLTSSKGYRLAASAYEQLGDYSQAEVLARTAVSVDEEHLPPYSPRLIRTYAQLGDVLNAKGDISDAIPLFEQALTLQKVHGQEDNQTLTKKVSNAYRTIGKVQDANSIY